MYLERFEIENIKCFAQKTRFDFTQPDGSIKKWNVILGENGTGKSTLLQAIALTLAGPEASRLLLPRPEGWARHTALYGTISATIQVASHVTKGDDGTVRQPRASRTVHYTVTSNQPYTKDDRYFDSPTIIETVDEDFKALALGAYSEHNQAKGWLACGYGPFRRLSGGIEGPPPASKAARFFTLFREGAAIDQRLQWLQTLYFQAQEESVKGNTTSRNWVEMIKHILESELFPEAICLDINAGGVFLKFREDRSCICSTFKRWLSQHAGTGVRSVALGNSSF